MNYEIKNISFIRINDITDELKKENIKFKLTYQADKDTILFDTYTLIFENKEDMIMVKMKYT